VDSERVSSSRVRTLLASGNFSAAARLLGRAYSLDGRVVRDQQLGRTIGVPTANLPLMPQPLTLRGVFVVMAELENGQRYPAVANVGFRPTVGSDRPTLEVHLLDFKGDLYGQRMTVFPCARLRGEVKFNDLDALKAQIERDQARARHFLTAALGGQNSAEQDDALPLASAPLGREAVSSDTVSSDTGSSNTISSDSNSAGDAADANNG